MRRKRDLKDCCSCGHRSPWTGAVSPGFQLMYGEHRRSPHLRNRPRAADQSIIPLDASAETAREALKHGVARQSSGAEAKRLPTITSLK